ncbi:MAG: AraC family transcriptional regulator [Lachnospiraceae bacterium]|jgi:AraC-like DNA-binding protein|nr:AraC family transcriptional regulator [Lachnospiraceae bacterium]
MKAFHEIRSYDSDFMVWNSSYENISFLAHWHKEIELIYIRSGSCRLHITDHIFTAHAGDLAVCESGVIHYSDSYDMDNSLDFVIFDSNILSPIFHNPNFVHPLITKAQLESYGLSDRLRELIDTVSSELKRKDPYYQEVVTSSLQTFWFLLKRHHPKANLDAVPDDRRSRMLADMQGLLDYIDNHFADNITLDYAANCMNYSNSYFSKIFKKLMGTNFVTYLNMVRVEHAAYSLRHTDSKITEIALNCGFNNIRTFNRVFKEITGCTPSEFLLLPDPDTYKRTYYNRRSGAQEFVENDSLTLVKNFQTNS